MNQTKTQKRNQRRRNLNRRRSNNYNRNFRSNRRNGYVDRTFNTIVPDKLIDNLKVTLAFNETGGSRAEEIYIVANDLYAPATGLALSTQPAGFDQIMALYQRFRVLRSTITIEYVSYPINGQTVYGGFLTCFPSLLTSGTNTLADAASQAYVRKTLFGGTNNKNTCRLHNSLTTTKMFGQSPNFEDSYSGTASGSPTKKWYWLINVFQTSSDDGTSGSVAGTYLITVNFHTVFYQRVTLDQTTSSEEKKDDGFVPINNSKNDRFKFL